MPRRNQPRIRGPFIMLPLYIIEGFVWKLLTPAQRSVFIEMRAQWQRQTHADYDQPFTAPYDELSCSSATAADAIKQLKRFGILTVHADDQGGLYKNATIYYMSDEAWETYELTDDERAKVERRASHLKGRKGRNRARRIQRMKERAQ